MNQLFIKKVVFIVLICLSTSATLVSCKAKAVAVNENATTDIKLLNSAKIIKSYYGNKSDFTTLYIKSSVKYSDEKQTQNVTAEIKIKKNEQILVSIRFLGITMAKALITPTLVSYYEKVGGTYFEGDYSSLSKWLGTDLDYAKVQNMLIGQAMDDLTKGKYQDTQVDGNYRLEDISSNTTKKYFFFDMQKFLLTKQEITQTTENRSIQVNYSDYKTHNDSQFPSNVFINAEQDKGKTEINLDYNTITINEELTFPYSVPSGYKRVLIK